MRKNQIVIVGAKSSGKTSILGRLRGQDFHL
jgi:GTPase SAR1 family protein